MLKTARMTGAVHTQAYLENEKEVAYRVCFNNNVYKTDQF